MPQPELVAADTPLTYTLPQLAARLQVSVRVIHEQRARGMFPFAPLPGLGRRLLFSRAEVEAVLARPHDARFSSRRSA